MKKIRIYAVHPWITSLDSFFKYTELYELRNEYEFEWTSDKPDYLMGTDVVLVRRSSFDYFKKLYSSSKITIMFAGEAFLPDLNIFDYAVGFNNKLRLADRYASLPSVFVYPAGFVSPKENTIKDREMAKIELSRKSGFCNFLYSNWKSHPMRDLLYYSISKYRHVDSLGRHLNNVAKKSENFYRNPTSSIEIKKPYKFSIASENAEFSGYISEKLLTSFAAHTIPIYWGDPDVTEIFNPEAFIHVRDYQSLDDLNERIKEIDENDELWLNMIVQPWQRADQIDKSRKKTKNYVDFFRHIFDQTIDEARRRPEGSWITNYREFLFDGHPSEFVRWKRIILHKLRCCK